jgi:murein L,D-transpeptidase YcbB/YkuD
LLRDQPSYGRDEIDRIVKSGITSTVMLKNRPEVYLLYLTAWVDEKSVLNFRRDIYERDKRLIDALASKPVYDIAQ